MNQERQKSQVRKHRKIVVVGSRGVGKTSLITRFTKGELDTSYYPTIEATSQASVTLDGTIFDCVHGYIVVLSITAQETVTVAKAILDSIMLNVKNGESCVFYLVANKVDVGKDGVTPPTNPPVRGSKRLVDTKEIQAIAAHYKCRYFEASARDGTNVNKIFESILRDYEQKNNPPEPSGGKMCRLM